VLTLLSSYLFLVERTHAPRASYRGRWRDWVWLAGTSATLMGFTSIAIVGFLYPIATFSPGDGHCRIGLRRYVTMPLLIFDVVLNIYLTFVFVWLLRPLVRTGSLLARTSPTSRLAKCFCAMTRRSRTGTSIDLNRSNQHMVQKLEHLLLKTFLGSVLVMIPTIVNLAALTILEGRELGWICLIACTVDGTLQNLWSTECSHERTQ
jgi:hypothetical protein